VAYSPKLLNAVQEILDLHGTGPVVLDPFSRIPTVHRLAG
jgi:hypothetical protein